MEFGGMGREISIFSEGVMGAETLGEQSSSLEAGHDRKQLVVERDVVD